MKLGNDSAVRVVKFGEAAPPGVWRFPKRRALRDKPKVLDFVVGGVSLYEVAAQNRDLTSVIWAEPPVPAEQAKAIRRLLAREPGDASDGRVSLFSCAECGDLGCGAITIRIDLVSDAIIWRDFGFENNYECKVERSAFSSLGPYHFDRLDYEARLQAFLSDGRIERPLE
jgi:hypothetical protein